MKDFMSGLLFSIKILNRFKGLLPIKRGLSWGKEIHHLEKKGKKHKENQVINNIIICNLMWNMRWNNVFCPEKIINIFFFMKDVAKI